MKLFFMEIEVGGWRINDKGRRKEGKTKGIRKGGNKEGREEGREGGRE